MGDRHRYLDHPGPIPFAHRGGALDAPENSMEAFAEAVALGYRYLETDVHRTTDGVLVAFHDASLDRVTDRAGAIADLTWSEVKGATVGNGVTIPRLEDLTDAWPDVRLNIDPKSDDAVDPLVRVIADLNLVDRVCVGSFSDARIQRARSALGPTLCTSMGPRAIARLMLRSRGIRLTPPAGACAQVPVSFKGVPMVTRRFVEMAHDLDIGVHVWTVNDGAEMHRLLDLGVDGIMTDRPRLLREVLEARDQWH